MRSTNNWNFALASLLIHRELNLTLGKGLKRDLVPPHLYLTDMRLRSVVFHPGIGAYYNSRREGKNIDMRRVGPVLFPICHIQKDCPRLICLLKTLAA